MKPKPVTQQAVYRCPNGHTFRGFVRRRKPPVRALCPYCPHVWAELEK